MSSPSVARPKSQPFTVDHFRRYCRALVLDNGQPWMLEDFQAQIVEDIFAGTKQVWVLIPEGNAKTTLMSGVALYHCHFRPTAEVLLAAASRDQAKLLFDQAAGFVYRSQGLGGRFSVFEGYRAIKCPQTRGRIQVFAADDRTGDGVIPTLAFLDEGHRHKDMKLVRTWAGKLEKRDGQLVMISTAGEPGTEFEDVRARAMGDAQTIQRDGAHTRAAGTDMVLHDWTVPKGADVNDMEQVKAANPLSTITRDMLRRKRRAPSMTETHWRRFVCNQAVRGEETAVNPAEWAAAGTGEDIPAGELVDVGVDLGWKHDTTAIVPFWMPDEQRRVFGRPQILVPPRDGSSLDPEQIKAAFRAVHDRTPIRYAVMDPDRGAEIAAWLENDLGVEVVEHGQSHQPMTLVYDRFMESLRNGWLEHPGDPEFTEQVLNAIAKVLPDGRIRFDRPSTSRAQAGQRRRVIDALVAAGMVLSTAVAELGDAEPFMFEVFS